MGIDRQNIKQFRLVFFAIKKENLSADRIPTSRDFGSIIKFEFNGGWSLQFNTLINHYLEFLILKLGQKCAPFEDHLPHTTLDQTRGSAQHGILGLIYFRG